MSVYKRNRKQSSYEKFLLICEIKDIFMDMRNKKDNRYFPKNTENTYDSFMKYCDEEIELLTSVYTRSSNSTCDINTMIELLDDALCINETILQLLQRHYKTLNLDKSSTKKSSKMSYHIFNLGKKLIKQSSMIREYKKRLKKKTKNNKDKEATNKG